MVNPLVDLVQPVAVHDRDHHEILLVVNIQSNSADGGLHDLEPCAEDCDMSISSLSLETG